MCCLLYKQTSSPFLDMLPVKHPVGKTAGGNKRRAGHRQGEITLLINSSCTLGETFKPKLKPLFVSLGDMFLWSIVLLGHTRVETLLH